MQHLENLSAFGAPGMHPDGLCAAEEELLWKLWELLACGRLYRRPADCSCLESLDILARYAADPAFVLSPAFWAAGFDTGTGESALWAVIAHHPEAALALLQKAEVDLSGAWGVRLLVLVQRPVEEMSDYEPDAGEPAGEQEAPPNHLAEILLRYGLDVRRAGSGERAGSMWAELLREDDWSAPKATLEWFLERGAPLELEGPGGGPVPAETLAAAWARPILRAEVRWRGGLRRAWVAVVVRAALRPRPGAP